MPTAPSDFESRLVAAWPLERWQTMRVLVAVSGGADSVALLRGLVQVSQQSGAKLIVAHLNHQLRGAASQADQDFVVRLAQGLGLQVDVGQANVQSLAAQWKIGLEEAARRARYQFFEKAAGEHGARYVAMAHTASDQAETILQRILRGTGLTGLAGIPRVRQLGSAATVIRPLLSVTRSEVLHYLQELQQPFQEDESNSDPVFLRNRIRHELLPKLEREYQPGAAEALVRLSTQAAELQLLIDPMVDDAIERCIHFPTPQEITIDCGRLSSTSRYIVREVLARSWRKQQWPQQAMGFAQWEQLASLVSDAPSPAPSTAPQMLPGSVQAQRKGEQLTLTRLV